MCCQSVLTENRLTNIQTTEPHMFFTLFNSCFYSVSADVRFSPLFPSRIFRRFSPWDIQHVTVDALLTILQQRAPAQRCEGDFQVTEQIFLDVSFLFITEKDDYTVKAFSPPLLNSV